jgi:hypothetical protein
MIKLKSRTIVQSTTQFAYRQFSFYAGPLPRLLIFCTANDQVSDPSGELKVALMVSSSEILAKFNAVR